jgi:5-hydroxyisourate hydrolase
MGVSTHILDTNRGSPAADVPVSLARWDGSAWKPLSEPAAKTDADGRVRQLLPETTPFQPGRYRVRFETAVYYEAQRLTGLYPYVEIVFDAGTWTNDEVPHYHIPLLLTANGYTTYRGS